MSHVLLKVSSGHTLDQLVVEIRARGGAPINLFPPAYVVARLGDGPPLTCGAPLDPATAPTDDPAARTAAATVMRLEERARNAGAPAPAVSWDVQGKKPPVFDWKRANRSRAAM